jgi:threonine dehydrogenase-like Zn-dependent dehydrogenase
MRQPWRRPKHAARITDAGADVIDERTRQAVHDRVGKHERRSDVTVAFLGQRHGRLEVRGGDHDGKDLTLAAKLGATHTVDCSDGSALEKILQLTHGCGADVAFEAVGVAATVDLAVRCVRKGGAVTLVGNVSPNVPLPLQVVVTRELTLNGSCASAGEYPACLDMMARGAIQTGPLLSAVAPLAEGATWFDRLYAREPGLVKVVLCP